MIHISKIHEMVGLLKEFSIKWVATSGEIISCERCTCTSFHGEGRTLNLMLLPSKEIRTVNRVTIIEFNGEEVTV